MFGWLCHATYCSVVSTSMLGVSHAVEVLVVGLLLVVCKIPYSSCTFNTAVVVARVILMVSTHVVDIGSDYFVVYLSCVYIYVRLATFSCVSTSTLGISHAVQNEKKFWKLT